MNRTRAVLTFGLSLLMAAAVVFGTTPSSPPALAAVTPRVGFAGTVLGWSSWYGSYDLGASGTGWCIDHGLAAPDPAFRYVPTVATDLSADQRAAMAWVVTSHGGTTDRVDAAAVMLVVHDLRGAAYPFGPMDVDRLGPTQLAGFQGHEADVIARARAIKAAGLAHRQLRGPFHLTVSPGPVAGVTGPVTATVTDGGGHPVQGALVRVGATGAVVDSTDWAVSGADGSIGRSFRLDEPARPATFTADASVPDPELSVVASTTVRAQRVARPAWVALRATADVRPPPTTTTTRPATTTTTRPTVPSTTTTVPTRATTTTSPTTTTAPTSTTSSTSSTSTSVAPLAPEAPSAPSPAAPADVGTGRLPVTGGPALGWTLLGAGLIVVGTALAAAGRRRAV